MSPSNQDPIVDVFLPTYGDVPYLGKALDSVLAQTESRWRLTLVDNSPERGLAAAILEPYLADPRVDLLVTGGLNQSQNWTAGMQAGDAPYVAMLHDDDWWAPEFLARRIAFLEQHPLCGFVFANYREVDQSGEEIAERAPRIAEGVHEPDTFVARQYHRNVVPVASVMFRRSALKAVGEHYADVRLPDSELSMRLAVRFPVGYLHVRDSFVRMHGGSVTSTAQDRGEVLLTALDYFDAAIDAVDPSLAPRKLRRHRRAWAHLTASLDAVEGGNRSAALRHLRAGLRLNPGALTDPRVPVVLLVLVAGDRASDALAGLRRFQMKHHIRVHRRDIKLLIDDIRVKRRGGASVR